MAWILDAVQGDFGQERLMDLGIHPGEDLVGVNINNERHMAARVPLLFEHLATSLDTLITKYNVRIIFLCNEVREGDSFDKAASKKVLSLMKHREQAVLVPNHYWSPQQMLSLISCCRLTLTTRYHFCLFSALQGVPFIAIKRSDKLDDVCLDMKWPYGVTLDEVSTARLSGMFSEIEERRSLLIAHLRRRVEIMRDRALRNGIPLNKLAEVHN
jgi:polysaccharide pyruvyl transferase WcaK-like protein